MTKNNTLSRYIHPVFSFLKKIPKGKAVTYKIVAKHCGIKNPRNVGWILQQNTEPEKTPCYKVVLSSGKLSKGYKFGGMEKQKKLLLADGVKFNKNGKIRSDTF